jgi:hypothetical protein
VEERRSIKRRQIVLYARVYDRRTGDLAGYLLDITPKGAMLLCEREVTPGSAYRLRVELPDNQFPQGFLNVSGVCMWIRPDEDPLFKISGFHLDPITDKEERVIAELNDLYEFEERDKYHPPSPTESSM